MGTRHFFLYLLVGGGLLWSAASDALAGAEEAERYRLQTEMEQLARRGAWPGVERTYAELEKLGLPLNLEDYVLGAQAAVEEGDLMKALVRVQVGLANATVSDDPHSTYARAKEIATNLDSRFGQVRLKIVDPKACTDRSLLIDPKPFAADERQAHLRAQTALAAGDHYTGMLPAASYKFASRDVFDVEAGQTMRTVEICDPKQPTGKPSSE